MHLAQQNLHFLDQGRRLLDQVSDQLFVCADEHGHACVGAHMRHVLDCYRCFVGGLEGGRIDYDARERNPRLETERAVAMATIDGLARQLATLGEADRHRPVQVRVDAAAWGEADSWSHSTLGRELQFLLSHTLHHYALIAMTLRVLGQAPDPSFGVAPSTLAYRSGVRGRSQGPGSGSDLGHCDRGRSNPTSAGVAVTEVPLPVGAR